MKYNWNESDIKAAVNASFSYQETLRKLGIPCQGNNVSTLKRKMELYNITNQHFTFHPKELPKLQRKTEEYLTIDGTFITSTNLKNRLIKDGFKENKCEICGVSEWQGKPLVCQLHHKNGNHKDNRLENLQILCPNCHSQTENYCGVSKKEKKYCPICGREVKTKAAIYCLSCASKQRAKINLSDEEFIKILKENDYNRSAVSRKLGVSETGIRKHIKKLGLPEKTADLKKLLEG